MTPQQGIATWLGRSRGEAEILAARVAWQKHPRLLLAQRSKTRCRRYVSVGLQIPKTRIEDSAFPQCLFPDSALLWLALQDVPGDSVLFALPSGSVRLASLRKTS